MLQNLGLNDGSTMTSKLHDCTELAKALSAFTISSPEALPASTCCLGAKPMSHGLGFSHFWRTDSLLLSISK